MKWSSTYNSVYPISVPLLPHTLRLSSPPVKDLESFATHLAAVDLLKALQNIEDPSGDVVLAETRGSGITPSSEGLEREGERLWPEGDGSRLPEGGAGSAAEERKSAEHVLRCKLDVKVNGEMNCMR